MNLHEPFLVAFVARTAVGRLSRLIQAHRPCLGNPSVSAALGRCMYTRIGSVLASCVHLRCMYTMLYVHLALKLKSFHPLFFLLGTSNMILQTSLDQRTEYRKESLRVELNAATRAPRCRTRTPFPSLAGMRKSRKMLNNSLQYQITKGIIKLNEEASNS